jgi:hypothetical protein
MAEITTDHDTIVEWADRHGGKPAAVDRTHKGDDVGIIRIMFPKAPQSQHEHLVEISWEEFFSEFDDRELALLYDPDGLFSKIIGRETAEKREQGDHDAARHSESGKQHRSAGAHRDDHAENRDSLKQREYRDSEGNVHHHTHAYMEQHRSKK